MRIGVLGAGNMTEALVPHWIGAGHELTIAGRTPEKASALAERVGAATGSLEQAADFGEVVLLAVHHAGVDSTLADAGVDRGVLAGKPLVDCTNPVELESFMLTTETRESLSERIAQLSGARPVKAFNLCQASVWAKAPRYGGKPLVVPIAGDDEDAKAVVGGLVSEVGCEPLDAGALVQARHLEAMAAIVIRMLFGGADPLIAFQLSLPDSA